MADKNCRELKIARNEQSIKSHFRSTRADVLTRGSEDAENLTRRALTWRRWIDHTAHTQTQKWLKNVLHNSEDKLHNAHTPQSEATPPPPPHRVSWLKMHKSSSRGGAAITSRLSNPAKKNMLLGWNMRVGASTRENRPKRSHAPLTWRHKGSPVVQGALTTLTRVAPSSSSRRSRESFASYLSDSSRTLWWG